MSKTSASPLNRIQEVPINSIVMGDLQVRKYYDKEALTELANSLSEQGTLQPLLVRPKGKKFELVVGSRRLKAAQQLKAKVIPACILKDLQDKNMLELALTENLQRQDLTPFEEAWAILKLVKDFKMGIQEVARRIGRHESFVRKRIKLLSVPLDLQKMVAKKQLPLTHVESIAKVTSEEEQKRIAKEITHHHLSHSDVVTYLQEEHGTKMRARRDKATLTGKRVQLKINGFTRFIQSVTPLVVKMAGGEVINVRAALEQLIREAQKAVKELKES